MGSVRMMGPVRMIGGKIEQQMIFARPVDQIPDFDRLVVRSRHNLGSVWGKRHRADVVAVGVGLLALELERGCVGRQEQSALAKEGRFVAQNAPESQTLIVLSPDTIVLPSGEKATDRQV